MVRALCSPASLELALRPLRERVDGPFAAILGHRLRVAPPVEPQRRIPMDPLRVARPLLNSAVDGSEV